MKRKKQSAYAESLFTSDSAFMLSRILACLFLFLGFVPSAMGDIYEQNKLRFDLNDDGTCQVIEYTLGGYKYDDEKIVIPEKINVDGKSYTVTSLGIYAFRGYINVPEIIIPSTVTSIGYGAFFLCKSLSEISIPSSVTLIGAEAFGACTGLKKIIFEDGNTTLQLGEMVVSENMFFNTPSLKEIYIGRNILDPYSTIGIDNSSFSGNKTITKITMSNYVSVLQDEMFANCSALNTLILSNSLTKINQGAFKNCSNLQNLEIPNSVSTIEENAFLECPLTNLTLGESVKSIGESAFYGSKLTSLRIPDSVISIGRRAFQNAPLSQLSLGNSLQTIGDYAFALSDADVKNRLKEIIIPNSVTTIGNYAFNNDDMLDTFDYDGIENVILGSSVSSIGYDAFGVMRLKKIVSYALTPPSLGWSFSDWGHEVLIYVTPSVVNAYKSDSKWTGYEIKILPIVPIESVTFDSTEWEGSIGETYKIQSSVLPSDVSDTSLIWTSSDPDVATVDAYGTITGLSAGKAVITASSHLSAEVKAECHVTVKGVPVESINLKYTEWSGHVGEYFYLTSTVSPPNASNNVLTVSSSNPEVATIDNDFKVTALSVGECFITITATDGSDVSASCKVTVLPTLVESLSFEWEQKECIIGEYITNRAIISPDDATNPNLEWTSSNPEIAEVSTEGLIRGVSVGEATITATTTDGSDVSASCKVTVLPILVESLSFEWEQKECIIGEYITNRAIISPDDATNPNLEWTSSNPEIAEVSTEGLIRGVSVGEAIITAATTDGSNLTASCSVIVTPIVAESISIKPNNHDMIVGQTFEISVEILPLDTTDKSVLWESSNPEVVEVDENGTIIALNAGSSIITATSNSNPELHAECNINVSSVLVESITLDCSEKRLYVGDTFEIHADVYPYNAADKSLSWISDNPEVASVDENGKVTAVSVGEAIISAKSVDGSDVSAECKVTVDPVSASAVTLNVADMTLLVGQSDKLTATVSPENVTDKTITWASDNETIATVDENGLVRALGVGSATITASTENGLTATCEVTVLPVLVEAIILDPDIIQCIIGEKFVIKASVLPENASNPHIDWESSNPDVASVDQDGNVEIIREGSCRIIAYATDGSDVSAECFITGTSGIESIFAECGDHISVYTPGGLLIKKDCSSDDLKNLVPGIYILKSEKKTMSVIIP